jgi:hypothetical protein
MNNNLTFLIVFRCLVGAGCERHHDEKTTAMQKSGERGMNGALLKWNHLCEHV